jgi:hypothetical protein
MTLSPSASFMGCCFSSLTVVLVSPSPVRVHSRIEGSAPGVTVIHPLLEDRAFSHIWCAVWHST